MTRRNFLKKSIGGGALFAVAGKATAQARPPLTLASADMAGANALAARLAMVTADAFTVETRSVDNPEQAGLLDRVAGGELDMAVLPLRHLMAHSPAFGMFDAMPFGLGGGEADGWFSASDGTEMLATLTNGLGVSIRLVADGGPLPLWSKAPLAAGDLPIRAIGARGLGVWCLREAGAGDVRDLDDTATDWNALDVIEGASVLEMRDRGLLKTFPHVARVNPVTPTSFSALVANDAALGTLAGTHRDLLETACAAQLSMSRARAFHENTAALLEAGSAIQPSDLPDDLWGGLATASQAVLRQVFESGGREADIVDAYVYFITDIAPWSAIGEAAYYSGRKRVLLGL